MSEENGKNKRRWEIHIPCKKKNKKLKRRFMSDGYRNLNRGERYHGEPEAGR
jgi:hypothetical protein